MVRKLFFSGIIVFIAPGSPSQLVVGCLFAVFTMLLSAYCMPYIADTDDTLATIALFEVFLVCFAALLIVADVSASENYDADTFGDMINRELNS